MKLNTLISSVLLLSSSIVTATTPQSQDTEMMAAATAMGKRQLCWIGHSNISVPYMVAFPVVFEDFGLTAVKDKEPETWTMTVNGKGISYKSKRATAVIIYQVTMSKGKLSSLTGLSTAMVSDEDGTTLFKELGVATIEEVLCREYINYTVDHGSGEL